MELSPRVVRRFSDSVAARVVRAPVVTVADPVAIAVAIVAIRYAIAISIAVSMVPMVLVTGLDGVGDTP